ncbi:hypothetical protein Tco_0209423 [Tanacetum coccineum]
MARFNESPRLEEPCPQGDKSALDEGSGSEEKIPDIFFRNLVSRSRIYSAPCREFQRTLTNWILLRFSVFTSALS